ncbi:MAG: ApeA N-terminal domain 1-containing protein [Flagellimonas sp.]
MPKEYNGQWSIPGSEIWFDGTLTYSIEKGGELKLFGNLKEHFFDRSPKEIILGKTNDGEITLINSYHRNTSSGNGITTQRYEPSIILEGIHVNSHSQLTFKSALFRAHNLFQWIDNTSIDLLNPRNDCKKYSIKYEAPENIPFSFGEEKRGFISFDAPLITNGVNNKIEMHEETYVHLHYNQPLSYNSILTDISKFINFLSLVTYEQSFPISIILIDKDQTLRKEESKPYKSVRCIYKHTRYNKKHKIRDSWYHLISFQDISPKFSDITNKWYDLHQEMESEILLLINFLRHKYFFSEDRFMECVRAIESFHRIKHKNQKLDKNKYNKLVQQVKNNSNLSGEDMDWLNAKLMGNEPSLGMRLEELKKSYYNDFIDKHIDHKVFTDAKNSRNYYTHFGKKAKKKALQGAELSNLTRKLRGLLISAILTELGIESKLFIEKLEYHLT